MHVEQTVCVISRTLHWERSQSEKVYSVFDLKYSTQKEKSYPSHSYLGFMGMVNRMGEISPNTAEIGKPLYKLLSTKKA